MKTDEYLKLEFKEWDRKIPVYSDAFDRFFFTVDELSDFCYDEEITDDDNGTVLRLILCKPNYLHEIDFNDMWVDILPEDQYIDDVGSKELLNAIGELNSVIRHHKPVSWLPGNLRTV